MAKTQTKNYEDLSNETGFQFAFKCDLCDYTYTTKFRRTSKSAAERGSKLLRTSANLVTTIFGSKSAKVTGVMNNGASMWTENTDNANYKTEKADALKDAIEDAAERIRKCPECGKSACPNCWDDDEEMCGPCAEKVKARREEEEAEEEKKAEAEKKSEKKKETEAKKAEKKEAAAASGEGVCPECGEKNPASMKFCGFCGAKMLSKKICPKCKTENPLNMKFCGECGTKLD
ncbi:MAG: zinc ribbon domain-containing protein [Clostridia bacterium]|nr:zinc ribbon domain-containing protein [Clostridia bacterium]